METRALNQVAERIDRIGERGKDECQFELADKLRTASGEEVAVEPFSFFLLFENQDVFLEEIGRLFGTAFLIILAILALTSSSSASS